MSALRQQHVSTRGSSPARPETAEVLGNGPPVTKMTAERLRGELGLARIHLCGQLLRRWPELSTVTTEAATGARPRAGPGLQSTGGLPKGSTASWRHQEHNRATTASGRAREHEARQQWRRPELGLDGDGG